VAGESPSGGQSESMLAGFVPGSRVAGYRVEARIGAGGMAVVFRAHDEALGRTVALKILSPALADDRLFRERFIRESRAVAAVDHPNIIPVYSAGEADGVLYLAMRFVFGGDLRGVLSKEGRLAGNRVADLLGPIALALDRLHADGLVHRDVKPANILVDVRPGGPEHPYLSDFGLVKGAMAATGLTGTGQLLGTLSYMAPEQISGKPARAQTDQYALACVAFNLLAGIQPFARDESMAVLWAHMYEPPPSLTAQVPNQPPAVDAVFSRAMAEAPEERYAICAEMIAALRAAFAGSAPPSAEPRTSIVPPSKPPVSIPPASIPPASRAPATSKAPGVPEPVSPGWDWAAPQRVPVPNGAPRVPPAQWPAPQPAAAPFAATMTQMPAETSNPGSGARTQADPVGNRPTAVGPYPPAGPRRRRRTLFVAGAAAAAVVIALGALLAVHPWSHSGVATPANVALGSETEDASGAAYSLQISWSGPAAGQQPDNYEIFRNGTQVGTVLGSQTSFTVDGLTPGTSYGFQVVAVSDGAESGPSATLTSQTPPLQPTGLAVASSSNSSLELSWHGPAAGPAPDHYEILRNGTEVTTVPGTVTTYTDQGLSPDTPYSYQVVAVTGSVHSQASAALASVYTSKPAMSDAVLDYTGTVTEKMLSVTPAAPGWTFKLGATKTDSWTMTPNCTSGPCSVTLDGAYNGYTYSTTLTQSGATYTGSTTLKDYYYCIATTNTFSATLNISITVNNASTQNGAWTATSFTGRETVNAPAYAYTPTNQTCYATVGQLSVNSGG